MNFLREKIVYINNGEVRLLHKTLRDALLQIEKVEKVLIYTFYIFETNNKYKRSTERKIKTVTVKLQLS